MKVTKPDYHVVSFSGGKDSTAMLLRMIELEMPVNEVLFCDTGLEFPAMYTHVNKVKNYVELKGIKFTVLKSKISFDEYFLNYEPERKNPDLKGKKGLSWCGSRSRWCTARLKVNLMNSYQSELKKKYNVYIYVGLAFDEMNRLERANNSITDHIYPLVTWGWKEKNCLEYCYMKGYDWGGLYNLFSRVSCWCCPLQRISELRKLRSNFPDLWKKLLWYDDNTWRKFRADYSAKELDIRFELEEEFKAKGLQHTMRNEKFKEEFNRRLLEQE